MNHSERFDFSTFPTLTTERLILREVGPADAADVFVFRSDYEVQKYNGETIELAFGPVAAGVCAVTLNPAYLGRIRPQTALIKDA